MDEETKKALKDIAQKTEIKVAESLLKWKIKKTGKGPLDENALKDRSKRVAERTHQTLAKRGMNIWKEFKVAYSKSREKEKKVD